MIDDWSNPEFVAEKLKDTLIACGRALTDEEKQRRAIQGKKVTSCCLTELNVNKQGLLECPYHGMHWRYKQPSVESLKGMTEKSTVPS